MIANKDGDDNGVTPLRNDAGFRRTCTQQADASVKGFAFMPASWNFYLLSAGAMLALASLDFLGSVFAKEWAERQHAGYYFAGLAVFGILFAVYAASLKVAELSTVTFGWIVMLQVGIVLLDTQRYGLHLPPGKWAAIAGLLLLQAYLILAPNGPGKAG